MKKILNDVGIILILSIAAFIMGAMTAMYA